ncbi:MAG: FmdE family protein [Deltaproteobacteria bacterium]|jgi:formylmethanofuran dehydrogenase subunit E|nr:FmdE family protein [Deltaproteobacteria bacterium]
MADWHDYLDKASAFHGHLCSGQVLGIRMCLKGLSLLGLSPDDNLRDLMIFLETDRCMADAAIVVTGVTAGRRRLKFKDYGKAAMSFLDLATDRAVRVAANSEPHPGHDLKDVVGFWEAYSDDQILSWQNIRITIPPEDRPGRPLRRVPCQQCGEDVLDGRDAEIDGRVLCKACAGQAYYTSA